MENQELENKSIRYVLDKHEDASGLSHDCVFGFLDRRLLKEEWNCPGTIRRNAPIGKITWNNAKIVSIVPDR